MVKENKPLTKEYSYAVIQSKRIEEQVRTNEIPDFWFNSADVQSAMNGFESELYPPNPFGGRGPFFTREDILNFIKKWFPKLGDISNGHTNTI